MTYKPKFHYEVEYRLIHAQSILRGEVGGFNCVKKFEDEDEVKAFVSSYPVASKGKLPEEKSQEVFFAFAPKVTLLCFCYDWYMLKDNRYVKPSHLPMSLEAGEFYCIDKRYFDLRKREIISSRYSSTDIPAIRKNMKISDTKRMLASDFTLYRCTPQTF